MKNKIVVLTIIASLFAQVSVAQNAAQILKNVDNLMFASKDEVAHAKITLTDKRGNKRVREADIKRKGIDRMLFRFTAPSSQAGIAFLNLPNDIMYLYMPAFGKERRIASKVKSQKFAGTDYSYEDMESKTLTERYTPKYLRTEGTNYVLELTPKANYHSQYSKIILYANKTNYYPAKQEYYDRSGKLVKTGTSNFEKLGKYWHARKVTLKDLKTNHTTILESTNVKYDQGLSDGIFSVRTLKN